MKYSKDGKVCFNPDTHTYTLEGRMLEGVTTFISRYKNPFDTDTIAEAYALKHGLEKDAVINQWKDKGKKSCDDGTAVHQVFETYAMKGVIKTAGICQKEQIAVKFIEDFFLTKRLIPVECEGIVYNEKLASQIDLIAKNSRNDYFILDWKTNEKIDRCSFRDKRMLPPFNEYPDCSFYHYSLQTCIYKHLCKEYDIKDLFIVHIEQNNYNILKSENIRLPNDLFN